MGSEAWLGCWGESRWGPLVIRALQSSPPGGGWWHCQSAAGHPGDARACGRRQSDWHKAGGSPCAERVGSAGDSRYRRTASRSLLQQRRLQSHKNTYISRYASLVNFSLHGGREITPALSQLAIHVQERSSEHSSFRAS